MKRLLNLKKRTVVLWTIAFCLLPSFATARNERFDSRVDASITLLANEDFHITDSLCAISESATITINNDDSWLFFDNIRPNDVVSRYADRIIIGGKPFAPGINGRIAIYRQGSVVMAHNDDYPALTASNEKESATFCCGFYYSNEPGKQVPASLVRPLPLDNAINHIKLARGYMATLACEPNGMGYSRVFVADDNNIDIDLPKQLSGKVSFIRVFRWQYPSKKGWVGSTWSSMPEGLKYAFQQADKTQSTWYYNWGSSPTIDPANPDAKTYNQEFVPEKWGAGGLWDGVYSIQDATHLLGYNEPDHSEQSNVTVDKAVEEWPLMMQTGMRLGSPATTNYSWLYNFIDKCRKLNYRVDYVVVHAYWGGKSATEWYNDLKTIHERTGRPVWIKEWNNGANWTKENWPSSQTEQYAKQLRDLTAIVYMLDTCSFVERYSLYNWVEDKRMVIDKSGSLTPAGEMYAADKPCYFFNHSKEVVPTWHIYDAPVLHYDSITTDNKVCLSWTDSNGEQVDHYLLQRNGETVKEPIFSKITKVDVNETTRNNEPLQLQIASVPLDETQGKSSNIISMQKAYSNEEQITLGETLVTQEWQPMVVSANYSEKPVVILGTPTYRNKMPLSSLTRNTATNHFDFGLRAWLYQQNPTFYAPDTLSYLLIPQGLHQWGSIHAEAGFANHITENWQKISFKQSFPTIPVVLTTATTSNDTTAVVAVRNINREGFEMRLRFEGNASPKQTFAEVAFVAATLGKGTVAGHQVEVGLSENNSVGNYLTGLAKITYENPFIATPYFFAQMQTENDTITASLRLKSRDHKGVSIFKDREKAIGHENVLGEQVGYMAIGNCQTTAIACTEHTQPHQATWYTLSGQSLPNKPYLPGTYILSQEGRSKLVVIR